MNGNTPATKADLEKLETRMLAEMEKRETRMLAEMEKRETRLLERIEKVETNLLTAFRNWAVGSETRLKVNELLVHSFNDRLTAVETRVTLLESGKRGNG